MISETVLLLDAYFLELNYYKKLLKILSKNKPFFFELNKLKKYNEEILEINNKIEICEKKIANLVDK